MKKKCKNCSTEFIPTTGNSPVMCPSCGMPAGAAATARAAFAQGEPILVNAGGGDEFDIQWMPPGPQVPVCFVDGEPRELKFTVKQSHAIAFDAQLQRLINLAKSGKGDLPFIDFNHEDGRASGRPTQIYYAGEDPKAGGIRLKGKWTASGKAAVTGEAPEFTRFSPEWIFNHGEEPVAIGTNLGGLVNKAAFKTIASVKAGAANHNHQTNMTDQEITNAITNGITAGFKPIGERLTALETAQAKGAETITTAVAKAMEPVNTQLKAITDAGVETKKAQAKAAVAKFITAPGNTQGFIPPADTDTITFWEGAMVANAADAEKQLGKLAQARAGGSPRRLVIDTGSSGSTATGTSAELNAAESQIFTGAKKIREGNKAIATDAQAIEAYLATPEGAAAYRDSVLDRRPQTAR